jgi:formylglycine-generating enzyme required for sulfatase activity
MRRAGRRARLRDPGVAVPNVRPYGWGQDPFALANQPVTGVSWYEAAAFCIWLTREGRARNWFGADALVRLPSEQEWDLAAIWDAASATRRVWEPSGGLGQNVQEAGLGAPAAVGLFCEGASPSGALDMAGNVWEWCASPFVKESISPEVKLNFAIDTDAALRGGSWRTPAAGAGWSARRGGAPGMQVDAWGFRVCLETLK